MLPEYGKIINQDCLKDERFVLKIVDYALTSPPYNRKKE